jgi:hypothetical protein
VAIVSAAALVEAWRPAERESLTAQIPEMGGSGGEAIVRVTRPAWLRPGGAGEVTLEVTRTPSPTSGQPAWLAARALVARLVGLGAVVSPGEEQAASWGQADRWTFTWRLAPAEPGHSAASLTLSLRDYTATGASETLLWARLLDVDVVSALAPPGASLPLLFAGTAVLVLAVRKAA